MFVSLVNYCSSSSLFHCSFVVCKDGSCNGPDSCLVATIGSVVGPSCVGSDACFSAKLSGVDLINSCKATVSCNAANANEQIAELIDCCNDVDNQCQGEVGRIDIVAAGGPSCVSLTCRTSDSCFFICQMTHSSLIHNIYDSVQVH